MKTKAPAPTNPPTAYGASDELPRRTAPKATEHASATQYFRVGVIGSD